MFLCVCVYDGEWVYGTESWMNSRYMVGKLKSFRTNPNIISMFENFDTSELNEWMKGKCIEPKRWNDGNFSFKTQRNCKWWTERPTKISFLAKKINYFLQNLSFATVLTVLTKKKNNEKLFEACCVLNNVQHPIFELSTTHAIAGKENVTKWQIHVNSLTTTAKMPQLDGNYTSISVCARAHAYETVVFWISSDP